MPLKEGARGEYGKLKKLLDSIEAEHGNSQLDREEVEFRHDLGEYDDGELKTRLEYLDATLKEQQERLQSANELRERFVAAFSSLEDLEFSLEDTSIDEEQEPPEDTMEFEVPPPLELDEST
ncbi:MAG: hypothetical protein GY906_17545 [bacterium]|nr:hypothetical protein [bacterium]